jgi:hypothetical protein
MPPSSMRTIRGINVAHASGAEMDWLAVSDVSSDVLGSFVESLARGGPTQSASATLVLAKAPAGAFVA